ncbi:MAG TPA: VOC family protein [Hanamia sp.]|nr:VOC family protein [Hanamia sp.]
MKAVNPYLNFNGNSEEAFNFYKSVFGGEFITIMRFKDTTEGTKLSPEEAEKIMHIALPLGKNNVLMATDVLGSLGQKLIMGNNFYISLEAESEEEGRQLFEKLSENGKAHHPFEKQFWGAWHGNLSDKFGVKWMVNYNPQQP